ncbi:MAG TPA: hypothetical protein VFQ43_14645 [Nitrososphaera sp.]|nr:hypothetical protein [Nitrososphaera sp.]
MRDLPKALFRLGLVIYMLSFFLVATGDPKGPTGRMRGYECAYFAVQLPLTSTPFSPDSADYIPPFMYLSILISGLINPVFVVYATLAFLRRNPRTVSVLKFALLSMIPFCWVVFHDLEVYPREGHVFWVIGMLLVLFLSSRQVPKSWLTAIADR